MSILPSPASVADLAPAGTSDGGLSAKKILQKMSELRPKLTYTCAGQFGPPEELLYVMQMEINGVTFQGIGTSKKSAKVMACTYALLHLGEIKREEVEKPPEYSSWPFSYDDFTEDIIDTNTSYIFCDFNVPYLSNKAGLKDRREGPGYFDESLKDGRQDDEYLLEVDHKTLRFLGRNPLGILGEVLPGAEFEMIEESLEPGEPLFVANVHTNDQVFTGAGVSKKLARARAAKEALAELCDIHFTAYAEDGMPLYEGGDDQLWQTYKAKLEADAETSLRISVADQDAQAVLRALYPNLDVSCSKVGAEGTVRHIAQYLIGDDVYEAEDLTEEDACRAAAETAVTALRVSGKLYEREREVEDRGEKNGAAVPKPDNEKHKNTKINPISKLMQLYPPDGVKFIEHMESKLPDTNITAFTLVVWLGSQPFVGVSKSKRGAKLDVAVKVLKGLGKWSAEDEENLKSLHKEENPMELIPKHKEKVEEIRQTKIRKLLKSKGVPDKLIEAGFNMYSTWNFNEHQQAPAGPPPPGVPLLGVGPGFGSPFMGPGGYGPQGFNPGFNNWQQHQYEGRGGDDSVQYPMPHRGGRGRAHPYQRGGGRGRGGMDGGGRGGYDRRGGYGGRGRGGFQHGGQLGSFQTGSSAYQTGSSGYNSSNAAALSDYNTGSAYQTGGGLGAASYQQDSSTAAYQTGSAAGYGSGGTAAAYQQDVATSAYQTGSQSSYQLGGTAQSQLDADYGSSAYQTSAVSGYSSYSDAAGSQIAVGAGLGTGQSWKGAAGGAAAWQSSQTASTAFLSYDSQAAFTGLRQDSTLTEAANSLGGGGYAAQAAAYAAGGYSALQQTAAAAQTPSYYQAAAAGAESYQTGSFYNSGLALYQQQQQQTAAAQYQSTGAGVSAASLGYTQQQWYGQ